MTEDQWRTTLRKPQLMYAHVAWRISSRKVMLIGAEAYRAVHADLHDWLRTVEGYADGLVEEAEFRAAREQLCAHLPLPESHQGVGQDAIAALALLFNLDIQASVGRLLGWSLTGPRRSSQPLGATFCQLIREIVGNPFRLWKAVPREWGGDLVQPDGEIVCVSNSARAIAAGIAAEQAFDRLPVLADALEDSGVTDAELLAHCRRPGGHLRGCWAVDVVMGTSGG